MPSVVPARAERRVLDKSWVLAALARVLLASVDAVETTAGVGAAETVQMMAAAATMSEVVKCILMGA